MNDSVERIFVLGSNSFTGATFVDYLLEKGESDVIGASRSPEPHAVFLPYKGRAPALQKNFRFLQLDLNQNLPELFKVLDDAKPSIFVNFAAQSMVAESWHNPDHWFETNVVATVRLHEGLRKRDFIRRYVHVSTPEVYGSCSGLVDENAPFNPSTPYAVSRAAADLSLRTYFKNYNFPVLYTRAANVYGPGQSLYRIIPRTILYAKTGKKLSLHGGGHSQRSFIHGRDVADATLRIARHGTLGESYHISTKRQISIRDLVALIAKMVGVSFESLVQVSEDRPGKDAAYLLDAQKLRDRLGWQDQIGLEQGIQECIDWVDANLELLRGLPENYIHKP